MQPTNYTSDIDDLFERMSRNLGFGIPSAAGDHVPVDVVHRDDELVVTADVPGFDPAAFDVSIDGDVLTIRAESERENVTDETYVRRERRQRSVRRTVHLPVDGDGDGASATYRNGVLTVTVPVESADARRIDVE